jgi:flagellar assembly protein FliH
MAQAAALVERFRFDRSFEALDDAGGQVSSGRRVPERSFTSEDVEEARAEGFARGRAEAVGAEEARRQAERLRQGALEDIAAQLRAVLRQSDASAQIAVTEAVLVASAIIRKMMPRLWRDGGAREIEETVGAFLGERLEEPMLTVRVAPALHGELLPALQTVARDCGAEDRLRVLADEGVPPGDCRIEWRDGGLLRDRLAMTRAMDEVIERSLGAAALPEEWPTNDGAKETTGGE